MKMLMMIMALFGGSVMARSTYYFATDQQMEKAHDQPVDYYDWGFVKANYPAYTKGYVTSRNRYGQEKPNKEHYYFRASFEEMRLNGISMEDCEKTSHSNLFTGRKASYYCFNRKAYNEHVAAYGVIRRKVNSGKWGAKLTVHGLNRAGTSLKANIEAKAHILQGMMPTVQKTLKTVMAINIHSCLDSEGREHIFPRERVFRDIFDFLSERKKEQISLEEEETLDVENLVDKLFDTQNTEYERCTLYIRNHELLTPNKNGNVKLVGQVKEDDDMDRDAYSSTLNDYGIPANTVLYIDKSSQYILLNGEYENYNYKRTSKIDKSSVQKLKKQAKAYTDFIKYNYGDLLIELYEDEASALEKKEKVKDFFQLNKGKIKRYLNEINRLSSRAGIMAQISISFTINQNYKYIRAIEKKMKIRKSLILDRTVESILN